jgi:predicted HicB family RNase H-like nuclease
MENAPKDMPDEYDLQRLSEIDAENDGSAADWEAFKANKEFTGQIALRLAKNLHKEAYLLSKQQGVSLNQFCSFCINRVVSQMLEQRP